MSTNLKQGSQGLYITVDYWGNAMQEHEDIYTVGKSTGNIRDTTNNNWVSDAEERIVFFKFKKDAEYYMEFGDSQIEF